MPEISLTDFVDFVAKTGAARLNHVRAIRRRGSYDPAQDFWRRLRDGIIEFHETNQTSKSWLDGLASDLSDKKKQTNYPNAIASYKSFLGRKTITWFSPRSKRWQHGGLEIRINPELGLVINGHRHHVKLYFKGSPLRKDKADMILLLLRLGLTSIPHGDRYAILDIQNCRLFADASPDAALLPLIHGEATAFTAIWNGIS